MLIDMIDGDDGETILDFLIPFSKCQYSLPTCQNSGSQ
jgi:hypothetical protein